MTPTYFKLIYVPLLVCIFFLIHSDVSKKSTRIKKDKYGILNLHKHRYLAENDINESKEKNRTQKNTKQNNHKLIRKNEQSNGRKKLQQNVQKDVEKNSQTITIYNEPKIVQPEKKTDLEYSLKLDNIIDNILYTSNGSRKLVNLTFIRYIMRDMSLNTNDKKELQDLIESYIYSNVDYEKNKLRKNIDNIMKKEDFKYLVIIITDLMDINNKIESYKYNIFNCIHGYIRPYVL
ncbi:putative exported protein [Plasmodium gaboni]|uniref:Putative exported protein n=1 Tax=Plasmodium gaboni TaxID=647221 RepID=A0A151L2P4_9APIC|nr:putative exported protein [Plasmodium gaboni]KYN93233.1 putative exported protein [Plasmodium gaboni]